MLRSTFTALYRTPLPNKAAQRHRMERNAAYYTKFRDMCLTCLRESSWCTRELRRLERRIRQYPTALQTLKRAADSAANTATKENAKLVAHTARIAAVKDAIQETSVKLTGVETELKKNPSLRTVFTKADIQGKCRTAVATSPTMRSYYDLRRQLGCSQRAAELLESSLPRQKEAVANAKQALNALMEEWKALLLRGVSVDPDPIARSTRAANLSSLSAATTKLINATKKPAWKRLADTQIERFKHYNEIIKISQMPFKETYRQLVFEGRTAEAEQLLLNKYQAVMQAHAAAADVAAVTRAAVLQEGGAAQQPSSYLASVGLGVFSTPIVTPPTAFVSAASGGDVVSSPSDIRRVKVGQIRRTVLKQQAERIKAQRKVILAARQKKKE